MGDSIHDVKEVVGIGKRGRYIQIYQHRLLEYNGPISQLVACDSPALTICLTCSFSRRSSKTLESKSIDSVNFSL